MLLGLSTLEKAVALGILEGLTEFIPVSSTGHLVLLGNALDYVGGKAATFSIFIQLGAILSVVVLYYRYFLALFRPAGSCRETQGFSGIEGLIKLFLTTLPALTAGFLLHDLIKEQLFSPAPIAAALIVGGIVMILAEKRRQPAPVVRIGAASYSQCLGVGFFQCLALWPGMSRSASTIIGAMLLGFERRVAAEFSFIMAVPIMAAAVGYDMLKSIPLLDRADLPIFAMGFVVSFVTAALAIKFFISMLRRFTLRPFGIYRILLGVVVLCVVFPQLLNWFLALLAAFLLVGGTLLLLRRSRIESACPRE